MREVCDALLEERTVVFNQSTVHRNPRVTRVMYYAILAAEVMFGRSAPGDTRGGNSMDFILQAM